MSFILTFLTTPMGRRVAACAAVLFAVLAICLELIHVGANGARKADAKALVVAKADISTHEAKAFAISSTAQAQLATQHTANASNFAPLLKRVATDVSDQDDHDCRVPDSWGVLWRAGEARADAGVSSSASGSQGPAPEATATPR